MIQRKIPPSPGGSKPKTPAQRNLKKVADQLIKKSYSYTKVTYAVRHFALIALAGGWCQQQNEINNIPVTLSHS